MDRITTPKTFLGRILYLVPSSVSNESFSIKCLASEKRKRIEKSIPELDNDRGAPVRWRCRRDDDAATAEAGDDNGADAGADRQHARADKGGDEGREHQPAQDVAGERGLRLQICRI